MIKKLILKFYRLFLKVSLNKISKSQLNGNFSNIKFLKRSFHYFSFENGMTMRGIKFSNYNQDPFGNCLSKQDPLNFDKKKFQKSLNIFYQKEKDLKIRDYHNIFDGTKYADYPIWSFSYPWEEMTIDEKFKIYPRLVLENRNEYTNSKKHDLNLYDEFFSITHSNQFNGLLNSFNKNGFIDNSSRPKVIVLVKNKKWKWIMSGQGNHRAYIMRFLNYDKIPVEISKIVKYERLESLSSRAALCYDTTQRKNMFNLVYNSNSILRGIV